MKNSPPKGNKAQDPKIIPVQEKEKGGKVQSIFGPAPMEMSQVVAEISSNQRPHEEAGVSKEIIADSWLELCAG